MYVWGWSFLLIGALPASHSHGPKPPKGDLGFAPRRPISRVLLSRGCSWIGQGWVETYLPYGGETRLREFDENGGGRWRKKDDAEIKHLDKGMSVLEMKRDKMR